MYMWFLQYSGIMSKKVSRGESNEKRKKEKEKEKASRKKKRKLVVDFFFLHLMSHPVPLQIRLPSALVNVVYIYVLPK